jgi:hypothetical protein
MPTHMPTCTKAKITHHAYPHACTCTSNTGYKASTRACTCVFESVTRYRPWVLYNFGPPLHARESDCASATSLHCLRLATAVQRAA